MKAQFKHADKSGARFALILGENEVQEGAVSIKDLLEGTQKKVPENELVAALRVWAS
jgi:histidyl-tRNA synthetase